MDIRKFVNKVLLENKKINCEPIKLTDEVIDYVKKFESSEQLLRSGGIPIEMLDRLAFGFSSDDIKSLYPSQIKIKWKEDLENVNMEIFNFSKKNNVTINYGRTMWARSINLDEPIEVSFEKNNFYLEDGHHRYYAAKVLGGQLPVDLTIKQNPILKLSKKLSYDDFHRCVFDQVNFM